MSTARIYHDLFARVIGDVGTLLTAGLDNEYYD